MSTKEIQVQHTKKDFIKKKKSVHHKKMIPLDIQIQWPGQSEGWRK